MYSYNPYPYNPYPVYYVPQQYYDYYRNYYSNPYYQHYYRQHTQGQATWTEGGAVTKCNMPWSTNNYMTAAVGQGAPYQCGQKLTVKNMSSGQQQEIEVTVVDQVTGYPQNKINLHKRAFEALGASAETGVINVEISVYTQMDKGDWAKYLMSVTQAAYPEYQISDYKTIGETEIAKDRTKVTYEFVLQAPQGMMKVRTSAVYHPKTNKVLSFDVKEV